MRGTSLVGLAVIVGGAAGAHAEPQASPESISKADAVFAEAQKLRDAGDNDAACAKFADALALNKNAVGAILNVGLCAEQAGKVASAARLFAAARGIAIEYSLAPVRAAAEEHLALDEPLVGHLAIAFDGTPLDGARLLIDGELVPLASAGDVFVDPGTRKVTVTAPGRVPFEASVAIAKAEHKAIAVPELKRPITVKHTRATVAKVLVGGGGGLVLGGLVLGYIAHLHDDDAIQKSCYHRQTDNALICDANGQSAIHSAQLLGNVGTVTGAVGLGMAATGVVLWFTRPADPERLAIVPTLSPQQAGLAAIGRF